MGDVDLDELEAKAVIGLAVSTHDDAADVCEAIPALIARVREAERERDEARAAGQKLVDTWRAEADRARKTGLTVVAVRDLVWAWDREHISFDRLVEELRALAMVRAEAAEARVRELEAELHDACEAAVAPNEELLKLRAVRDAAAAVLVYEWGDPAKGCTVAPGDSVWLALRAALAAARGGA